MPQAHWIHPDTHTHGCQNSECREPAYLQWQRASTQAESDDIQELYRRTGVDLRAREYDTAVFACEAHSPDLETAALRHQATCPLPDEGCDCADS